MSITKQEKQTLPNLPYAYDALEPYISAEIMELHHKKHHNAYVTNFNKLLTKADDAMERGDLSTYLSCLQGLKFNGGGHENHSLFWNILAPKDEGGGEFSSGALADQIFSTWGSPEEFIEAFNAKAKGIQGSGWCWLGYGKQEQELVIETTANQDPLVTKGLYPLMGIDMWEHAFYLKYKNDKGAYLKNIWEVINWRHVAERYSSATSCSC